ncbi:MAG: histidinol-phosphate transaminase [Chloroflexota bacterium]
MTQRQLSPDDIIDFSTNNNPYGPPPMVLAALQEALQNNAIGPYPDRDCLALKAAIAAVEDVSPEYLLPGNGTAALIQMIALAFVRPQSTHLIVGPTFGEYERAIQVMEGKVIEYRPHTTDLRCTVDGVASAIQHHNPASIWLCNPNNPTGQQWTTTQLQYLQDTAPNALWVIDEAYTHFPTMLHNGWLHRPNQIILRSFTKDFTLAGLRLGYILALPHLIDSLQKVSVPWSVNALSQIAGVATLQAEGLAWRRHTLQDLRHQAKALWRSLQQLGLAVLPTETTYALVDVEDAPTFRAKLLAEKLLVRDCTSFGLPNYVRIAAQHPTENQQLVEAIQAHV